MLRALLTSLVVFFCTTSYTQSKQTNNNNHATSQAQKYLKTLQDKYAAGNYELHKIYADSLYEIATQNDLAKMQVIALVNQGISYKNKLELQMAMQAYREALELCNKIPEDYKTRIVVLTNLGNIYRRINAHDKATTTMQEVLHVTDTIKDAQPVRISAYIALANTFGDLYKDSIALQYALKGKNLAEEIANENMIGATLGVIGDIYIEQGKYKDALLIQKQTLGLKYAKTPNKNRAGLLLDIGRSYLKLNELDSALLYYEEAKALAKQKELINAKMNAHKNLAKIFESQGNLEASLNEQKEYLAIKNYLAQQNTEAISYDLNKDIAAKEDELNSSLSSIAKLKNNTALILLVSLLILSILGLVLFRSVKQKRKAYTENSQLQEQYKKLKATLENEQSASLVVTNKNLGSETEIERYKNSTLTNQDYQRYRKRLLDFMKNEKPYLNADLKQADLANSLEIPSHHLSELLSVSFEQNFYTFINSYRVMEAQRLMKDPTYTDAKMLAIAFDAGFKSKTTFNRIFKSYSGSTPSDYRNINS